MHERLFSFEVRKRLGRPREYGRGQFGFSAFGQVLTFYTPGQFGDARYGKDFFGAIYRITGVWRRKRFSGGKKYLCQNYYFPTNPRSIPQQNNRTKFANAVLAWQNLTTSQKEYYNDRESGRKMSGYNIFLHNFMSSP